MKPAEMMDGWILPGDGTAVVRQFPIPKAGHGQVVIKVMASTISETDIRAIYRQHLGTGAEKYRNVIAGHEPAGIVYSVGAGCRRLREGDRVCVYDASRCGQCGDCRRGYAISCPADSRAAYGWQRDGGMAQYMLAEERDCLLLPESVSYVDGACVACCFGTCYEAVRRLDVSGDDRCLVVGLGPMGLATCMLARARGASFLVGVDVNPARATQCSQLNLADLVLDAEGGEEGRQRCLRAVMEVTEGMGCEKTIDTSGHPDGRLLALQATRRFGSVALVGEGNHMTFQPSNDLLHKHIAIHGVWVSSYANMEALLERLDRWRMHPEKIVTHYFALADAAQAYETVDKGNCGKVAVITSDEE
ncbi:unnamed protein product [Vitrella brassicaformis CCMP3155]|uniref:Enoyl reductase (ER) domain-containing protein n=1 Tax=Vitrella brassicaformis (strain CCMP3155) TaxID=1169540 RepID=A0A0G4G6N1_VITBC|nr:unnamed protein product [Vitrella brassicaformis CCMP3155]|eukprot:CEM24362.1 unnamed protein product [Vitrella brassicaformis CCMP3155]